MSKQQTNASRGNDRVITSRGWQQNNNELNLQTMSKQTSSKMGLVKKLVEILAELGPVEKKGRNPHFGYNYVSEGQVMSELRHKLSSRNVFLSTSVETCVPQYGEPKAGVFVLVTTKHTFRDADTGEELTIGGAGLGWDSGDKGVYKAITGATKYALMKNFLITDEQDPETGEQVKPDKPAGAAGHRRTRAYEEETGSDDKKVATDLIELKAYLTQHKIPDGFLLTLLTEKKLIDGHTKNVAMIKPGVLRRVLSPKSLDNLLAAWKQQQADEESGSATAPSDAALAGASSGPPYRKGVQNDEGDASKDAPPAKAKARKKAKADDDTPDLAAEVRTNDGDQRRKRRVPVTDDIAPTDMLGQEGYDNWREVEIHFGKQKGTLLGKLAQKSLAWWIENYKPEPYKGTWQNNDLVLDAALCLADMELGGVE